MDISAAFPTFLITLREGVEAALVVGIVLALLQKIQQSRLNVWVYAGVGVGLIASALTGGIFTGLLRLLRTSENPYAIVLEPLLEGILSCVAIALLSWMLVWMTRQARSAKAEVEGALQTALQQGRAEWGVFSLVLVAVLREGFEAAVFVVANLQQGWLPVAGAVAGALGAAIIGALLFRWGVKINLRRFFQVMGVLLLLIVSGLVISALKDFEVAAHALSALDPQWAGLCAARAASSGSCLLGPLVWDGSAFLPDRQFPGILLKTLLGYRDHLYLVQMLAYGLFLAGMGTLYFRSLAEPAPPALVSGTRSS